LKDAFYVALDTSMRSGTFFKLGGTRSSQKNCRKILWFELATVTSQAMKDDVINFFEHV